MDTKEHIEIQKAIAAGQPETDEGPFYHESWWEAYKGSIKGKLGGAVVGALVGALVGTAAALILPVFSIGALTLGSVGALAGTFAAAGMAYGAHEFSDVGRVTGAVAAAQEKAEQRQQSFEEGKFAEIRKELGELKAMLAGKSGRVAATPPAATETETPATHCDEHCPPKKQKPIFWKVAAIGLAVGMAAGALLTFGGAAAHLLAAVALEPSSKAGLYAAAMTTMGLFGASFGINRDVFRQIFDKTDRWFKGLLHKSEPSPERQIAAKRELAEYGETPAKSITTIVYEGPIDYPESETHHRDKVLAQARDALLRMDHTKSIPH
jgi:hypothetical protein